MFEPCNPYTSPNPIALALTLTLALPLNTRYNNTLLAKWFEKPEWPLLTPHLNRAAWLAGYTPSVGSISLGQIQIRSDRSKTAAGSRGVGG